MIKYREGSLFDAPKGGLLVHACNAQGVWGSGIAKEFKKKFPTSFEEQKMYCDMADQTGNALITSENVGCLFTSRGYSTGKDNEEVILKNTKTALEDLLSTFNGLRENYFIYSNKFNSGLFGVPWGHTEILLHETLRAYPNVTWIVYKGK